MSNEIKLGDIVVFKTGNRAFEVIGKYIVPDDRLWRVDAITENEPPTTDRNRKYRLVAVDCPNVMLDEIPERYVESYSEKLEREFEEQRKEALKMNRNEIKQGDKVRVSENAPEMFRCGFNHVYTAYISKVLEIDDGNAIIEMTMANMQCQERIIIPTKYLVKVEEEKKEGKFEVGDKVIFIPTGKVKVVSRINANSLYTVTVTEPNGQSPLCVRETELAPYTEPTEEVNLQDATREFVETHPFDIESLKRGRKVFEDMFWDAYTAELAKDIALKVANKKMDNHPEEIGAYAVSVAKAVVEGLKRK